MLALFTIALAALPVEAVGSPPEATRQVAVLPFTVLAADAHEGEALRQALADDLRSRYAVRLVDLAATGAAVRSACGKSAAWWDCLGQTSTLLALGQELGADVVIAGRLARIGETSAVQLRVVEMGAAQLAEESIARGEPSASLLDSSMLLTPQLFGVAPEAAAAPAVEPAPQAGWPLWVGVVGVAAAGVIVVGAVAMVAWLASGAGGGSSGDGDWDHRVVLP